MSRTTEQSSRQRAWTRLDSGLLAVLLVVAALIRLAFARAVVFPPLDDPAFYLATARNLALGRGLEVDVLWSYQMPFAQVTHPSHEHWMPLPTLLIAVPFALERLLDASPEFELRLGQMPGLVLGTLLVPLTYAWGRRLLPGGRELRGLAFFAGLLVAGNATLAYQAASADSSAPFALFSAWALACGLGPPRRSRSYVGAGLLIALAYLARSDGALLLAVPLACLILPLPASQAPGQAAEGGDDRSQGVRARGRPVALACLLAAFGLLILPWLVRNTLAFGTPLPTSVLRQAWLLDYVDTFSYGSPATPQTLLAAGWPAILAQRAQALLHSARVLLSGTFPWGVLALPGAWLLRRRWAACPALAYGFLLLVGLALAFPVSATSGTVYHSQGALFPFLALAAVHAVHRGAMGLLPRARRPAILPAMLLAAVLALSLFQAGSALGAVRERHEAERAQFEGVAGWLARHAAPGDVVMTTQPYSVHWASDHPCIALPAGQPPAVARQAAERYGARWLVVTQAFGRYPTALHDGSAAGFLPAGREAGSEFYAIQPPGEGPQ